MEASSWKGRPRELPLTESQCFTSGRWSSGARGAGPSKLQGQHPSWERTAHQMVRPTRGWKSPRLHNIPGGSTITVASRPTVQPTARIHLTSEVQERDDLTSVAGTAANKVSSVHRYIVHHARSLSIGRLPRIAHLVVPRHTAKVGSCGKHVGRWHNACDQVGDASNRRFVNGTVVNAGQKMRSIHRCN
jgi:hypothetical protein